MGNFEKAKRITAMALILCMVLGDIPGRTFNNPSLALAEESSENNNPEDTIIESKDSPVMKESVKEESAASGSLPAVSDPSENAAADGGNSAAESDSTPVASDPAESPVIDNTASAKTSGEEDQSGNISEPAENPDENKPTEDNAEAAGYPDTNEPVADNAIPVENSDENEPTEDNAKPAENPDKNEPVVDNAIPAENSGENAPTEDNAETAENPDTDVATEGNAAPAGNPDTDVATEGNAALAENPDTDVPAEGHTESTGDPEAAQVNEDAVENSEEKDGSLPAEKPTEQTEENNGEDEQTEDELTVFSEDTSMALRSAAPLGVSLAAAPAAAVPLAAATPADASDPSLTKSALQAEIDNALLAVTGKLTGRVQVILSRNTTYESDIETKISIGDRKKEDDFELEISAEDAGADGMQGEGKTVVKGNITIHGIKVIMNSIILDPDHTITVKNRDDSTVAEYRSQGGELILNGSKNFPNEMTVKVGDKSRATITTTDDDDIINLELTQGAAGAIISTGDGVDTVNLNQSGGVVDIKTGFGDDRLSLVISGKIKSLDVDTGDSNDTVSIIDSGKAENGVNILTGTGDDTVSIDVRDNAGSMTIDSGAGSDVISITKGDHFTLENRDYENYSTPNESPNINTDAVVTLKGSDRTDRITIDASTALALKGVQIESEGDGASVHLKGELANIENPITEITNGYGPPTGFRLHTHLNSEVEDQDYTLDLNYGTNHYTDTLKNKRTVMLTATGDTFTFDGSNVQSFTNYVLKSQTAGLKRITVNNAPPIGTYLANFVLDADQTLDLDEHITVNELSAENMDVVLLGKTIDINGKVEARSLWAESARGTVSIMANMTEFKEQDQSFGEFLANMFSVRDTATINVNSGAKIHVEQDVSLVARVKHSGGMLTFLPTSVNLVNVKLAEAAINIRNGAQIQADEGNVTAEARIKTVTGYDYDDATNTEVANKTGMPVAVTVILNKALVTVEQGARIRTGTVDSNGEVQQKGGDVNLIAESNVKTATYANSIEEIPSPVDVAVTVIVNQAKALLQGTVEAGNKVMVSAQGEVKEETVATGASAQGALSGGFIATSVVLNDVDAIVDKTAVVKAGGNLRVETRQAGNATTKAISGATKPEDEDTPNVKSALKSLVLTLIKKTFSYFKNKYDGADDIEKQVEKMFADVAEGDYSVRVAKVSDENDAKGSATVTTQNTTDREGKSIVQATIQVTPAGGCKVTQVGYRYLRPGEDHYTYVYLLNSAGNGKDSFSDTFTVPSADVEIFARYTGEPNGEANANAAANQNNAGDVNIAGLVDDAAEGAGKAGDDLALDRAAPAEGAVPYTLTIKSTENGAVVTWNTGDDRKNLTQVYSGEKIRLIPNPKENPNPKEKFKLKENILTVTYKITKDGKQVTKNDVVTADDQGRYIFTVPEGVADNRLTVNAEFVSEKEEEEKAVRNYQATGSIAVGVLNNNSHAIIEDGATVTAGGVVDLFGFKINRNTTTADGTAVEAKSGAKKKSNKPVPFLYSSYGVGGAEFAMTLNSNVKDAVSGAITQTEDASGSRYSPVFTMDSEKANQLQKVILSYYTKLEGQDAIVLGQGTRRTITLTRQADGKYKEEGGTYIGNNMHTVTQSGDQEKLQLHLTGLAVQNGTTVDVNFVFKDEGQQNSASSEYLIANPIQISYNKLKEKNGNIIEMGTVAYDGNHGTTDRYYFRVEPKTGAGYTIDARDTTDLTGQNSNKSALYASWVGADGKEQKAALKKDANDPLHTGENVWFFDAEKGSVTVPDGAVITIHAVFREDLREIQKKEGYDAKEGHGDVTIETSQAKAGDKVTLVLKPEEKYMPSGVQVEYYKTGHGWTPLDASQIMLDPKTGKATFKMPETDQESSHINITPVFSKKDVELGKPAGGTNNNDYEFSEKDGYTYAGGKVTVLPSAERIKEGYKVTQVTVKNGDKTWVFENNDSFDVKAEWFTGDVKYLEITPDMDIKPIRVADTTLENGKLSPVSHAADAGENVVIKAEPEEGYRVKQGSMKAEILMGTESKQIVLMRGEDGNYSFTMPANATKDTVVTLLCEFEPGSEEVKMSLGAAVSVGVLNSENAVEIKGGQVSAAQGYNLVGLTVGSKATTEALAGYSAGNIGIAGALGIQVVNSDNKVAIRKGGENSSFTLNKGMIFMLSKGKIDLKLTADAKGKKTPEAKNTGVGAGIAVGVSNLNILGTIEDGKKLATFGKDGIPTISGITINAGQKYKDVTSAKAGAVGGSSWVPVAAVDVSSVTSRAQMGRLDLSLLQKAVEAKAEKDRTETDKQILAGELPVSGKVKIKSAVAAAKAEFNRTVEADASSRGGSAAVGGAFAVAWTHDQADAILNQSLNATKAVSVTSSVGSATKLTAVSAVSGGVKSKKGDADQQGNKLLGGAANIAGKHGGMDANKIKNDGNARQKAETAESSIAAAGAFVLNVQNSSSLAEVRDGVSVITKGKLEVKSSNRTAGSIKADASATKSNTGIGVGVAINIVDMDNIARIGNGKIEAAELEVSAEIAAVPGKSVIWNEYSNTTTLKTALESQIKQGMMNLLPSPYDSMVALTGADGVIAKFAATFAEKLIRDLGMDKLVAMNAGQGIGDGFVNAGRIMLDRLIAFPQTLAAPFVNIFEEVKETFGYMDSEEDWSILLRDAIGTATTEMAGDAWQTVINKILKDGGNAVIGSAIGMVTDKLSGKGWDSSKVKKNLKDSLSGAMDSFLDTFINTVINKMGDRITFLKQGNIERAKAFKNELKRLFKEQGVKNVADDLYKELETTFREQVYDYEKYLIKYSEGSFLENAKKELWDCMRESSVAMTNELMDNLAGKLGVKFEKEPTNDRHMIITQAISGAGGSDDSGAGSLAVSVVLLNTAAEIKGGQEAVTVTGAMGVHAEELRRIRTYATAAVDARGEADNKDGEGESEQNKTGESAVKHVTAPDSKITVDVGVGGAAEFDRLTSATEPQIWLTPAYGYHLSDGDKLNATYKEPDSDEEHEFTVTVHAENGKFYIKPLEDIDAGRNLDDTIQVASTDLIVNVPVVFDETLRKLSTSTTVEFPDNPGNVHPINDFVTLEVKDREENDHNINTRPGEQVQIIVLNETEQNSRPRDQKVKDICVEYTDAKGEEKNLTLKNNDVIRTTSNSNEIVYIFNMPDGDVKDITVSFEPGKEDTDDTDASGRKVGVGAAVAVAYGKSTTEAKIGSRDAGVEAASLAVVAETEHEQQNYTTAGTDPLKGTATEKDPKEGSGKLNEKDIGIDASVSVFIVDNNVTASIANGTKVTTTGDPEQNLKASWNINGDAGEKGSQREKLTSGGVVVQALESGKTETRASSFATGSTTVIGGAVAVNVALSEIKTHAGGEIQAKGAVTLGAESASQDETYTFASAMGADVQRALNKFADKAEAAGKTVNKLTSGEYYEEYYQKEAKKNKEKNKTAARISDRLNDERVKDKDGDEANEHLNVSANVLRSQNAKVDGAEDADKAAGDAANQANDAADRDDVQAAQGNQKDKKLQIAAAVGVTVALHSAAVTVEGAVHAGSDVTFSAVNAGNFSTRSTAASITAEHAKGNIISAAVGISVNSNKATVDVKSDVTTNEYSKVDIASRLTMNMEEGFISRLPVQSLSGAVSGKGTSKSIAGAAAVTVSHAVSKAEVTGINAKLEGGAVSVTAFDQSKLGARAGGVNISTGANVGAGVSAAVIYSDNEVTASVADGVEVSAHTFQLDAVKKAITWENFVLPWKWTDVFTDSTMLSDEERAQVQTGLIDIHREATEWGYNYKVDLNLDTYALMKLFDAGNMLAFNNYYTAAIAGSLVTGTADEDGSANAFNGAGAFSIVRTDNRVKAKLGNGVFIHRPTVGKGGSADGVRIYAEDTSTARLIGGALAAGTAMNSWGVTATFLKDGDEARAETGTDVIIDASKLTIGAKGDTSVQSLNAAASVNTSGDADSSIGGAVNILLMKNQAEAKLGDNVRLDADNGIDITAGSDMDLLLVSAGIAGAGKGIAAGGTAAYINDEAASLVTIGNRHAISAGDDVNISAKTTDRLLSVLASASAAFSKNLAAAGAVNVLNSSAKGNVTLGAGDANSAVTSKNGSVAITGNTDTRAINITVSAAGSRGTAIGMSVNVNRFDRESIVEIAGGEGYTIQAAKDVLTSATGNDTTIMAGLAVAGSTKGLSLAGNLPVLLSKNRVKTHLGAGTVHAGGEAAFASHLDDHTYTIAGSIALANNDSAVGGTAMILKRTNEVTTDVGTSVITAEGSGRGLKDRVIGASDFSGIYVGATAGDTTIAAAAGAALADDIGVTGNVLFGFNTNTVRSDTSRATLNALNQAKTGGGSVTVEAKDDSQQVIISGGVNFGKLMGLGAAVVSLSAEKNVDALMGRATAYKDVNLTADNKDKIFELAVNGAFSQVLSVGIGAAIQSLGSKVNAIASGDITAQTGSFALQANNTASLVNAAGVVAGSETTAASPVGAVTVYRGRTNAILKSGTVDAAKAANVRANADKTIQTYTVGAAGSGKLALSGALTINSLKDVTRAQVLKDAIVKADTMDLTADSNYRDVAASAALSFGGTGAAAVNAMISVIKGATLAELDGRTDLQSRLNIKATSDRDIINGVASLGAGFKGAGAGVTLMVLTAGDKMDQDAADLLTYGNAERKNEDTKVFDADSFVRQIKALGADTSALEHRTNADGSVQTSLAEDLQGNGHSDSNMNIGTDGKFDASSGYVNQGLQSAQDPGDKTPNEETEDIRNAKKLADYVSDTLPTDVVEARIGENAASVVAGGINVTAQQETKADLYGAAIGVGASFGVGISGAAAKLRSNVIATSLGHLDARNQNINIQAISRSGSVGEADAGEQARASELRERLGAYDNGSDEIAADDDQARKDQLNRSLWNKLNPMDRSIRVVGIATGGSVGAGIAASIAAVRTDNITRANLGNYITNASAVNVDAHSDYDNVLAATIGAAGSGTFSASASVALALAQGTVESEIDGSARITGEKTKVSVTTHSVTGANAVAATIAGSGGVAAAAGVAIASNSLTQNTSVDRGFRMEADGGSLNVSGTSTTTADTYLLGVAGGMGAVGLSAAISKVKPTLNTTLGAKGEGTASLGNLSSVSVLNDSASTASANVLSLSGGAKSLQGSLLLVFNETDATAKLANVSAQEIDAVTVNADLEAKGDARLISVNVGGVAGGISVSYVDVNSKNRAIVDTDRISVTRSIGKLDVTTGAKGHNRTEASTGAVAASVGGVSAGINASIARNRAMSLAEISGSKGLNVTGGVNLKSTTVGNAAADTIGMNIGLASVAASVSVASNEATSHANMKLKSALLADLNAEATVTGETKASQTTGSGALLDVKANIAQAHGRTNALVDVDLAAAANSANPFGISAVSRGTNQVTTDVGNQSFGAISAVMVGGLAESEDLYSAKVTLGKDNFTLSKLNVQTGYETTVDTKTSPAKGGVDVNLGKIGYNAAIARSRTNAGAELVLDGTTLTVKGGPLDVTSSGKATANAEVRSTEVNLGAITIGVSKSEADLSANQAATLKLRSGSINGTKKLNVKSIVEKAEATANVGTPGVREADKTRVSVAVASVESNKSAAKENIASTASVLGESGRNTITAEAMDVHAVNADGVTTKAIGRSDGAFSAGLVTVGNLDATGEASDRFSVVIRGVKATIGSDLSLKAQTNTSAQGIGAAPGSLSVVNGSISEVRANVGSEADRQTAKVLIDDDVRLMTVQGQVNILARNQGEANASMRSRNQYSVLGLASSSQPTNSWYDTGVIIGDRAEINGQSGLNVASGTDAKAISKLDADGLGLILNSGTMKGENHVHEVNSLMVGKESKLISGGDISLSVDSKTDADAQTEYNGGFGIIGKMGIYADSEIDRDAAILIKDNATIEAANGSVNIASIIGKNDRILTTATQRVSKAVELGKSHSTVNSTANNNISVGSAVKIAGRNDVKIQAVTTGSRGWSRGYDTYSDVNASGLKLDTAPDAYATNNLTFNTGIAINRDGQGNRSKYTHISSQAGKVEITASNEGLIASATAGARGGGIFGSVTAHATTNANFSNLIWVDGTTLSGAKGTDIRSNFGEGNRRADFENSAFATLEGIGPDESIATMAGNMKAEIRTNDTSSVAGGSSFTHLADTDIYVLLVADDQKARTVRVSSVCDFCLDKEAFDNDTTRGDASARLNNTQRRLSRFNDALKNGFAKALAPLNKIESTVDTLNRNGITKARYGEGEESLASGAIYVLDIQALLTRDVQMSFEEIGKFRLWTNAAVYSDVFLLPNAARLYMAGGRLRYVTDVICGDALNDGRTHDIDIITALTPDAFAEPVIPIGSAGSLDFRTGTLLIPEYSDLELYVHELSASWFTDLVRNGTLRVLQADQDSINACALEGEVLPEGRMIEGLIESELKDGWKRFWIGVSPAAAEQEDQVLYYLMVNGETDEMKAFRTSVSAERRGEAPMEMSLFFYRDSKSDRRGENRYNIMLFDTPAEEMNLAKIVTNVLENREMEMPTPLRVVLRRFDLDGADLPGCSISDHLFAMNDGTDGAVSMFDGFYQAVITSDVFDSAYMRVEGISGPNPVFTIKANQPIWPTWTGEDTAEDLNGTNYRLEKDGWYADDVFEARISSSNASDPVVFP